MLKLTRLTALAVLAATPAFAQTTASDPKLDQIAPAERLNLIGVYAHASPTMKVVLFGLTAAVIAAVVVWARQALGRGQGRGAGLAYLSAQAAAAPLFGLFGVSYALLSGFIGISNVRPTPNLTILAPGLAEAALSLGLGLLAAAIATVGYHHLKGRLQATEQAQATPASRPAPLARAIA
jgi:biopolymer transport protein ExbB/TolQ